MVWEEGPNASESSATIAERLKEGLTAPVAYAGNQNGEALKAIADAEGLPLAYLEQVVARLRKAGLVMSARGAPGGYWLSRPAEEIAMVDVVQALEGAIAPMECFVHDHTERVLCSHEADAGRCATKLLWTRVQGGIIRSLQTTTLAELVEFSRRAQVPEPV